MPFALTASLRIQWVLSEHLEAQASEADRKNAMKVCPGYSSWSVCVCMCACAGGWVVGWVGVCVRAPIIHTEGAYNRELRAFACNKIPLLHQEKYDEGPLHTAATATAYRRGTVN